MISVDYNITPFGLKTIQTELSFGLVAGRRFSIIKVLLRIKNKTFF